MHSTQAINRKCLRSKFLTKDRFVLNVRAFEVCEIVVLCVWALKYSSMNAVTVYDLYLWYAFGEAYMHIT